MRSAFARSRHNHKVSCATSAQRLQFYGLQKREEEKINKYKIEYSKLIGICAKISRKKGRI
jgi:hypothetical protein